MTILLILVYLLCIAYGVYTGQVVMALSVLVGYAAVLGVLRLCLKPKSDLPFRMYTLFTVIYGTLVLLTHMELIHDPFREYYVHNDAAMSFYKMIMTNVLPCSWGELFKKTIGSSLFYHYPLAAFVMSFFGKLGMALGVENLRLFLRIHIFLCGSSIIAIMTNLLDCYKMQERRIKELVICFGLFTYLYISSAIFTRDIYVTFVYAVAAYVCLKKDVKRRLLLFVILFFLARGFRPQNGLLLLVYPIAFYYKMLLRRIGKLGVLFLILVCLGVSLFLQDSISMGSASLLTYEEKTMTNTGGMFIRFYQLPFPLNTFVLVIYMLLMPLPVFGACIGKGMTWLNLPYSASPYLLLLVIFVCGYYVYHKKDDGRNIDIIILASFLIYVAIIFGSPDVRRAFAAIPGLYMCYALVEKDVPSYEVTRIKRMGWPVIAAINLFFAYYVYF